MSEAGNGRVALEQMQLMTPQIILLDLMMPEMNGFQFITEVRRNPDWRSIPIIVVTARGLSDQGLGGPPFVPESVSGARRGSDTKYGIFCRDGREGPPQPPQSRRLGLVHPSRFLTRYRAASVGENGWET